MKKQNVTIFLMVMAAIVFYASACSKSSTTETANTSENKTVVQTDNPATNKTENTAVSTAPVDKSKIPPADFTMTAEELYKAFGKNVSKEELEKFKDKSIAFTGRVQSLSQKEGELGANVSILVRGTMSTMSCFFDDNNVGQMKSLKEFQKIKILGHQNGVPSPGIVMLDNCVVLEDNASSKDERADFTTTAKELYKEFKKPGVKSEDLEKYMNATIALTGGIADISATEIVLTDPTDALMATGSGIVGDEKVTCGFDAENAGQLKTLQKGKQVKVLGFQDTFVTPGMYPRLKHCVVLEAK